MIPRLQRQIRIADANGLPSELFMRWWLSVAQSLDTALTTNAATDASQSALIATLNATVSTLSTAVTELEAVREAGRSRDSQISGLTITPGANSVTISSHSRSYLDPTQTVAVTGSTLNGLAAATTYFVHYTDVDRVGGAVGYQTSLTLEGATATLTEPFRHFVGRAVTGGAGTNAPAPYWRNGL